MLSFKHWLYHINDSLTCFSYDLSDTKDELRFWRKYIVQFAILRLTPIMQFALLYITSMQFAIPRITIMQFAIYSG